MNVAHEAGPPFAELPVGEVLFGQVAVRKGYLSDAQVQQALQVQARDAARIGVERFLGRICVELGLLSSPQVEAILAEQVGQRLRDEDKMLGQLLLLCGFVNSEQLNACVRLQATSPVPMRLGELLVERGVVSHQARQAILRTQQRLRRPDWTTDLDEPLEFGNYLLLGPHAAGGQGYLYKAVQKGTDRHVILKLLLPAGGGDAQSVARFKREARIASRLRHPNIVQILDAGQIAGQLYIVMEYISGKDLAQTLKEGGPLLEEDATRIVRDVALALEYAHALGVAHRDIKPSNIVISRDGYAILTDFGLARWAVESGTDSQSGLFAGTVQYLSPERVTGAQGVDLPSDIYSLGAVLYECLTGKPPHGDGPPAKILWRILHEEPAPLHSLRPNASAFLDQMCSRAMARDLDKRYPSIATFAADLDAHMKRMAIRASPTKTAGDRQEAVVFATTAAPIRVIVADDDADSRTLLRAALEDSGIPVVVTEATNGDDALRLAREQGPDLLVLDIHMPGKSGLEVCAEVTRDPALSRVAALLVTAAPREDFNRTQGIEFGAIDYIRKPVDPVEMAARVRSVLRMRQAVGEIERRAEEFQRLNRTLAASQAKLQELNETLQQRIERFANEQYKLSVDTRRLRRYLSTPVVSLIAGRMDEGILAPCRREVSLVATDLRQAWKVLEGRSAPEVIDFLSRYCQKAMEVVYQHGGTIDTLHGTHLVAYFGAPLEERAHAAKAVDTAGALLKALDEVCAGLGQPPGGAIGPVVVVHSGLATVGVVGSEDRYDLCLVGDLSNTAVRLLWHAPLDKVVLTESTLRLLAADVQASASQEAITVPPLESGRLFSLGGR